MDFGRSQIVVGSLRPAGISVVTERLANRLTKTGGAVGDVLFAFLGNLLQDVEKDFVGVDPFGLRLEV